MPATPALRQDSLGAWLLKASPAGGALDEHVETGFANVTTRCVRPSYRTSLVRAGQPVLLWVSGRDPRLPAGLHAVGETTGPVDESPEGPVLPVRLAALVPPVPRAALAADPVLSGIEVLRMPAGSNPSYLDVAQYAALCAAFPQVDRPDERSLGNA
ncbi:hypothetical protein [Marmoricola sp. URHB0036]|uniref:hypothetical protein n=1 Tax=Marmoricola sp. URHB0036 TaxID=1298863 RepID=UPI00041D114E|nr:hypothetical protein [Marmoricola sp. URHB0036]